MTETGLAGHEDLGGVERDVEVHAEGDDPGLVRTDVEAELEQELTRLLIEDDATGAGGAEALLRQTFDDLPDPLLPETERDPPLFRAIFDACFDRHLVGLAF